MEPTLIFDRAGWLAIPASTSEVAEIRWLATVHMAS
jgi:hypothetical protein